MTKKRKTLGSEVSRLYDAVIAHADALSGRPVVLEALWDGDTQGWMLDLYLTLERGAGDRTRERIQTLRYGGDIRLFTGAVPPWPESEVAVQLGARLERELGCDLWFPCRGEPDDEGPAYDQRAQAIECADCNKLIIPTDSPHRPQEICYQCHLRRERAESLRREPTDSTLGRGCCIALEGQPASTYLGLPLRGEPPLLLRLIAEADPGCTPGCDRRLAPRAVAALAQLAVSEVERLLEVHDPAPTSRVVQPIQVEWRGRQLELEPRMNRRHGLLWDAIRCAKFAEEAEASGLAAEVYSNAGIKKRDGHLLGEMIRLQGQPSRTQLHHRHAGEFGSQGAVDDAISRLLEAGCIRASLDTFSVTRKGEVLGNRPEESG